MHLAVCQDLRGDGQCRPLWRLRTCSQWSLGTVGVVSHGGLGGVHYGRHAVCSGVAGGDAFQGAGPEGYRPAGRGRQL